MGRRTDALRFSAVPEGRGFARSRAGGAPFANQRVPSGTPLNVVIALLLVCASATARADDLADQLRKLDPVILTPPKDAPDHYRKLLPAKINAELKEANQRSTREWKAITNLEQWEAFRKAKMDAMRKAIGRFPDPPKDLKAQTTKTLDGEGFKTECLVFESRPRFLVTANLYVPDPLPASLPGVPGVPGIIIHPAHHNPKTQSELQDMGMTWARAGCYVLVMDQVGHGERRAHPFATEKDYPKPFKLGRQDYWFRYNTGMQLHLIGDSLIGWQAYDLMRGVDLLLTRKNIDKNRIIMMGSVAGGGDPVAVTAALDERIACAVVFNFGGPQPETRYPLPEDAEETFNYAGGGSWESTRNMSFSARDGFLPWVIVGSIAPRRLIYAHEFTWDKDRDPVWKRLQKIYEWHGKPDNLAFAHGYGFLRESSDKASHANNIGPPHRKHIYPALKKWFNIPEPKEEYTKRRTGADLLALTPKVGIFGFHSAMHEVALAAARQARKGEPAEDLKTNQQITEHLRQEWGALLGPIEADRASQLERPTREAVKLGDAVATPFVLRVDGLVLPAWLLTPPLQKNGKPPVVVLVAQHGKAAFFKERSDGIASLLQAGVAVCLPDLRGTGETRLGSSRGRSSWDTSVSSSALMLGQPMLGQRLRDLRSLMAHLRSRDDVDATRIAIWGDSFAPMNDAKRTVAVPHDAADMPEQCEPLGGLLALLGALFEEDVKVVFLHRGLFPMESALKSSFLYMPHDVVVPRLIVTLTAGEVTVGEVADDILLLVHLARPGRAVRLAEMVDALNQPVDIRDLEMIKGTIELLADVKKKADFRVDETPPKDTEVAAWLAERLKK